MNTGPATDLPADLRLPDGMVEAPLRDQLAAARSDLQRWIRINHPRTQRTFGEGAMSPITYRAGLQARISICRTLHAMVQAQSTYAA